MIKTLILKNLGYIRKYIYLIKNREKMQKTGILIGEPNHGNIGDAAIAIAEHKFLEEQLGIDIVTLPARFVERHTWSYKKVISEETVILFHGGGFIGTLWPRNLQDLIDCMHLFPNNRIIIMPQRVFFSDDDNGEKVRNQLYDDFKSCNRLTLCVREKHSYDVVKKWMPGIDVRLMPDMVTYLQDYHFLDLNKKCNKEGIICCMRRDVEKVVEKDMLNRVISVLSKKLDTDIVDYTDTVLDERGIREQERMQVVTDKLNEFASHQCVITDRLHGMVLAAITDTPCIALGCNNYKIQGVYEWIKNNKFIYFLDAEKNIDDAVDMVIKHAGESYSNIMTRDGFAELKKLIKQELC